MRYTTTVLLVSMACLVGCGPHVATSVRVDEQIPPGAMFAVLPFENLSGRDNAAEKITDYVVLSLQSASRVSVVEFGTTYEHMRKYRIRSTAFITDAQIDSLASGLGVAYLVLGSVFEFTETDNQYLGKVPQVSVNVRVIKCATRRTVWSSAINSRGDQGEIVFGIGAVRSKEELAQQVVGRAVDGIIAMVGK